MPHTITLLKAFKISKAIYLNKIILRMLLWNRWNIVTDIFTIELLALRELIMKTTFLVPVSWTNTHNFSITPVIIRLWALLIRILILILVMWIITLVIRWDHIHPHLFFFDSDITIDLLMFFSIWPLLYISVFNSVTILAWKNGIGGQDLISA